jgi:hypothetical protein
MANLGAGDGRYGWPYSLEAVSECLWRYVNEPDAPAERSGQCRGNLRVRDAFRPRFIEVGNNDFSTRRQFAAVCRSSYHGPHPRAALG